jgi:ribonuclease HII
MGTWSEAGGRDLFFDKPGYPVLAWARISRSGISMAQAPTFAEEEKLWAQGCRLIAGVDEVGRGPLAGPVVAAAVILPTDRHPSWLRLLRDSKQLLPGRREELFTLIQGDGIPYGLGIVSQDMIDALGIAPASRLAMREAIRQLPFAPDFLLIDYVRLASVRIPQMSITKGDSLSLSIAAASIVAKVTRDRMMVELDGRYPGYGFARHKGYGTPEHLELLHRLGPCQLHRRSFAPVQMVSSDAGRRWGQAFGAGVRA